MWVTVAACPAPVKVPRDFTVVSAAASEQDTKARPDEIEVTQPAEHCIGMSTIVGRRSDAGGIAVEHERRETFDKGSQRASPRGHENYVLPYVLENPVRSFESPGDVAHVRERPDIAALNRVPSEFFFSLAHRLISSYRWTRTTRVVGYSRSCLVIDS